MTCEDYRAAIAADPSESFAGGAAHAAGCVCCRRYRDAMRALDERIAASLAIDVPPPPALELPPIDAGASAPVVALRARLARTAALPAWIGFAAAVAVAAFLGARMLAPDIQSPNVADQVIAHMDHEQESRQVTTIAVSEQALASVVEPRVSSMDAGAGLITYARNCVINDNVVPHLVIQGEQGPLTLILMPEETIESPIPLSGKNVHGVIVPVGGGSVAIVGERAKQLNEIDQVGRRLVASVKWRT